MLERGDKKAQGLSTTAIILIVLGVVVLVVLIIGFTIGWSKIAPWVSTSNSNIDAISQQCEVACTVNSVNDFCLAKRELVISKTEKYSKASCYTFSVDDKLKTKGITGCPSIDCAPHVECSDWKYNAGTQSTNVNISNIDQTKLAATDNPTFCFA